MVGGWARPGRREGGWSGAFLACFFFFGRRAQRQRKGETKRDWLTYCVASQFIVCERVSKMQLNLVISLCQQHGNCVWTGRNRVGM